jgi:hypothetical protein
VDCAQRVSGVFVPGPAYSCGFAKENIMGEMVEECLEIVERIAKFGGGKLPRDRAALVGFIVSKFAVPENLPPEVRSKISLEQWELVRANFAAGLAMACDCVERERAAQYQN